MNDVELARKITIDIYEKTGLIAACGISYNLFLAKNCLDNDAIKNKENGYLSKWTELDIKEKLWKISSLNKIWGVGKKFESKLVDIGIEKVEDIAKLNKKILKIKFGTIGEELYENINGRELAYNNENKITVYKSFTKIEPQKNFETILKEIVKQLCIKLFKYKKIGNRLSINLFFEKNIKIKCSFYKMYKYSRDANYILINCKQILLNKFLDKRLNFIELTLSNLIDDKYENISNFGENKYFKQNEMVNHLLEKLRKKQ